eukprot:540703-Pelagomonas_calceolata.AAC.1
MQFLLKPARSCFRASCRAKQLSLLNLHLWCVRNAEAICHAGPDVPSDMLPVQGVSAYSSSNSCTGYSALKEHVCLILGKACGQAHEKKKKRKTCRQRKLSLHQFRKQEKHWLIRAGKIMTAGLFLPKSTQIRLWKMLGPAEKYTGKIVGKARSPSTRAVNGLDPGKAYAVCGVI